jgi:hypothetical protein
MSTLLHLPKLRALYLNGDHITDDGLRTLAAVPQLFKLALNNTSVTGVGFSGSGGFRFLGALNVSDTLVSDKTMPAIARLPALRAVQLDNTSVTDAGLNELSEVPRVILSLRGTRVTQSGVNAFTKLRPDAEVKWP